MNDQQRAQHEKFVRSTINVSPSSEGIQKIERLRASAQNLAYEIITFTEPSREQSIALTNLEETVMWAVKTVVLQTEDQ